MPAAGWSWGMGVGSPNYIQRYPDKNSSIVKTFQITIRMALPWASPTYLRIHSTHCKILPTALGLIHGGWATFPMPAAG